jgi:predicted nucleic acid-binding protein
MEPTAYEHARIWVELEASGNMIGYYDLIVGATALERGSEVAKFNKRLKSAQNRLIAGVLQSVAT